MIWQLSDRADRRTRLVADRHYNRQKIGATHFVPPGRCVVLYAERMQHEAFWVTSYPEVDFVRHAWAGLMVCSAFRNEGVGIASKMILDAVAVTRARWPCPPDGGMITFVDTTRVKPTKVRGESIWGFCYRKAGFQEVGYSKIKMLLCLQLPFKDWPDAQHPLYTYGHNQRHLFIAS